tara:strand:+ start:2917 stop:3195 length:279 start_codon:yes stop_codon:yes gene_type:complete
MPQHPDPQYRYVYRFWLYLPPEHAEALTMQEHLTELHDEMFAERRMLMDGRAGSVNRKKGVGDADVQECRTIMLEEEGIDGDVGTYVKRDFR